MTADSLVVRRILASLTKDLKVGSSDLVSSQVVGNAFFGGLLKITL